MNNTEPDYDNLTMVRMAIVERDDRLVVLLPPTATPEEVDLFAENVENLGWPVDRILVLVGPEAFAVLKPSVEDEGQRSEEQAEGDEVDPSGGGDADYGTLPDYSSHEVSWRGHL